MKVSKKVAGVEYAIRDIVSVATKLEQQGKKIQYLQTQEAIKQRHVDLDAVTVFEQLGICFGREKKEIAPDFEEIKEKVDDYANKSKSHIELVKTIGYEGSRVSKESILTKSLIKSSKLVGVQNIESVSCSTL